MTPFTIFVAIEGLIMGAVGVTVWQKAGKKRGWLIGVIVVALIALVALPTTSFMMLASSGGNRVADLLVVQTQVVSGEERRATGWPHWAATTRIDADLFAGLR